jgi:hypothetical protein
LYGVPKIGKTTLASKFPGAWFFATEEGQDWLPVYEPTVITSWAQFLKTCAWIEEHRPTHFGNGDEIRTLVFDTGDFLFKLCFDYTSAVMGVSDLSDLSWGKGWKALGDEFQRVFTKISRWPYGFIFISHSKEQQIKAKASAIDRIQPGTMTTGLRVIHTLCDIILYCYMNEYPEIDKDSGEVTGRIIQARTIRCQPKNNIIAGDRTGRLPAEIPMDYDELLKYFPETEKGEKDGE